MRFWITIGLIGVLSALGLTYEIAAGRVLAPFFGTSLLTWTSVIAVVLAGFSVGNALGGFVAELERPEALRRIRAALVVTAALAALSPTVLRFVYDLGARGTAGMAAAVIVAFGPASVLVSLPSPLLARIAIEARPGRAGSSLGWVLASGSLGAIVGAVLTGFVALPLIGSVATFAGCGALALACAAVLPRTGAGATPPPAVAVVALVALALVATIGAGRGACRYESGLSCIDIVRDGETVRLLSDRVSQAAERNDDLALPYTRWIWQRMERDLGDAPAVLFIGGGGYSLPSKLISAREGARAVTVEIDPLVTDVVRENMPWAGRMLDRIEIVHADGRVYLNESAARFDGAVLDAFSSGSVPAHLVTRETFARLDALVSGPIYVNLIDAPDGRLVRGVLAGLREIRPHTEVVQGPVSSAGRANSVIVAARASFESIDDMPEGYAAVQVGPGKPFTDDRSWVGHR